MSLLLKIHYNAVYGGLGGLMASMLYGIFFQKADDSFVLLLLGGLLIGGSIGYFVVSVEGLRDRSLVRFCHLASYGLVLGAIGGALGLALGEGVNRLVIGWVGADRQGSGLYLFGAMCARGLGWMFLGLAVGVSEGVAARSLGKFSYGAIGGSLGGFIGGALYALFYTLGGRQGGGVDPLFTALGLVILGASIGSLAALVRGVFQPASLKVMRGWQEGREYALDKPINRIGRDEYSDIPLFRDMRVEKQHALIQRDGNRYILVNNNAPPDYTKVNGTSVSRAQELKDGDRIELGQIILRFQTKAAQNRRKAAVPVAVPVPENPFAVQ